MRPIDADAHECWACVHHQNETGKCDTWCDSGESFELREDVKNAPTIEPCGHCTRREFYQKGYQAGYNEAHEEFQKHLCQIESSIRKEIAEKLGEMHPEKECFEFEDDYIYAEERHNKYIEIVKAGVIDEQDRNQRCGEV